MKSFVAIPALTTALILSAWSPSFAHQTQGQRHVQVLVIGGGLGGLSTMDELHRQGLSDVLLLESTSRTGGKIWTERQGPHAEMDALYERGAELVNSSDKALIALLRRHGVNLVERRFVRENRHETLLFHDRTFLSDGTVEKGALRAFTPTELIERMNGNPGDQRVLERLHLYQEARVSESAEIRAQAQKTILSTSGLNMISDGHYAKAFLEALFLGEFGRSTREVNAEVLLDYVEIKKTQANGKTTYSLELIPASDERYRIEGGSDSIIRKLTDLHVGRIQTNSKVVAIEQQAADLFLVRVENPVGSGRIVQYRAENVVFAAPSYELKEISVNVPEIPQTRLRQAADLPFGSNAKIFLHFNEKFWDRPSLEKPFTGVGVLESGVQFWDTSEDQKNRRGGVITLYPGDWPDDPSEQRRRLQQILSDIKLIPAFRDLDRHLVNVDQQVWKKSYAGVFSPEYGRAVGLYAEILKAGFYFVGSDKDNDRSGRISAGYGYMDGAVRTALRAAGRILKSSRGKSCAAVFKNAG